MKLFYVIAGNGSKIKNNTKEKEVDISTSNSDTNARYAYTSRVVEVAGIEPASKIAKTNLSTEIVNL